MPYTNHGHWYGPGQPTQPGPRLIAKCGGPNGGLCAECGREAGLKQRPGDQPLPTPNDQPDVQSMVMADITARREVGIQRYGTALQPFNGRDALRDLYEELLDACMYIRQAIEERDARPADASPEEAATARHANDHIGALDAYSDHHIVDLREDGWTVQHPLSCRPYLFDCPVNEAAEHELVDRPAELGRFTCGLDDDGRLEIGDLITDALGQPGDQGGTGQ